MKENVKMPKATREVYEQVKALQNAQKFDEEIDLRNQYDWSCDLVEKEGKFGLKNCFGETVAPTIFENFKLLDWVVIEAGGRIVAQKNGKWGIITAGEKEEWILPAEYDSVSYPNNLVNLSQNGKYGVYNLAKNEFFIPLEQDRIDGFDGFLFVNGLGFYEKDGKTGVFNDSMQITPPIFEEVEVDGDVSVKFNGEWGYATEKGEFTTDPDENAFYEDI